MNKCLEQSKKRYLFINPSDLLAYNINQLPPQLRNKIYIMCMRNFWRNYIPLTAKVPSWYQLSVTRNKQLFYAQQNNVHLLHLSFNTLYKNRKYIVGCQCHFCKYDVSSKRKRKEQQKNIESIHYFNKVVPFTDSKWNDPVEYIYNYETAEISNGYTVFTPYYDVKTNIKDKINGPPIKFGPIDYDLF